MENIVDPNDPFDILKISKIVAIRNSHSILNHLKRLNCLVCSRESPGFDIPCSDMLVLERGKKVPFTDNITERFFKKSKVIENSVKLDFSFNNANQCIVEDKYVKGVCIDCSKYFHIDDSNNIKPNHDYSEYVRKCRSADSNNTVIDDFDVNQIAPYSAQNLVTTNLWNDEAYDLFCENSLTLLEKIVLTPLHLSVTVMRLKTNNVPFSAHGVMVYPLKKSLEARFLPWYDFSNLPFLVTTFRDKIGNINEGTVDMSNIVKAREFMTRLMIDPVYGKERYFYRFCNEVPFSNENMRMLADALSNPNKRFYPTKLRRLE